VYGEPNPDHKLRAQKPVKKIDTEFVPESHKALITGIGGVYHPPLKVYPRRTNALVARLQEQQSPWLRDIKAVGVSSLGINVLTGIVVNGPGKQIGRTICSSILDEPRTSVSVQGVARPETSPILASCQYRVISKLPSR
jgi:hypothetical protein